jgi:hypothetical protein
MKRAAENASAGSYSETTLRRFSRDAFMLIKYVKFRMLDEGRKYQAGSVAEIRKQFEKMGNAA